MSKDFQGKEKYLIKCAIYTVLILSVGGQGGWFIGWPTFADQEFCPASTEICFGRAVFGRQQRRSQECNVSMVGAWGVEGVGR